MFYNNIKVFLDTMAEAHLNTGYVSTEKEMFALDIRDLFGDLWEIVGIQFLSFRIASSMSF